MVMLAQGLTTKQNKMYWIIQKIFFGDIFPAIEPNAVVQIKDPENKTRARRIDELMETEFDLYLRNSIDQDSMTLALADLFACGCHMIVIHETEAGECLIRRALRLKGISNQLTERIVAFAKKLPVASLHACRCDKVVFDVTLYGEQFYDNFDPNTKPA